MTASHIWTTGVLSRKYFFVETHRSTHLIKYIYPLTRPSTYIHSPDQVHISTHLAQYPQIHWSPSVSTPMDHSRHEVRRQDAQHWIQWRNAIKWTINSTIIKKTAISSSMYSEQKLKIRNIQSNDQISYSKLLWHGSNQFDVVIKCPSHSPQRILIKQLN